VETVKETIDHKKNFSIAVPKKSNIFIEQTLREKENAQQIHNIFQTDLWRMRLTAAKITLHVLKTGDSTFSGGLHTPIKLLSEIYGVGPQFTLALTLENMSATNVVTNLSILFHANTELYKIENVYSKITPLIPGKR
jgi:Bardet-Biedl syndrome 1 protein